MHFSRFRLETCPKFVSASQVHLLVLGSVFSRQVSYLQISLASISTHIYSVLIPAIFMPTSHGCCTDVWCGGIINRRVLSSNIFAYNAASSWTKNHPIAVLMLPDDCKRMVEILSHTKSVLNAHPSMHWVYDRIQKPSVPVQTTIFLFMA